MKKIITILILVFTVFCFGQPSNKFISKKYLLIGYNPTLQLKVIKRIKNSTYYLISKNKKDTLIIDKDQTNWGIDTCVITQKQLDNIGKPELIIEHTKSKQEFSEPHIGTSTTLQVWNIDTKTKLFSGVKNWHDESQEQSQEEVDNNYKPKMVTNICAGGYDVEFLENGNLIVKNLFLKIENNPYCKSDHFEGLYILKDGKYNLSK